MTINERIKLARMDKNLTQTELAQKLKTTKQTIYKYENGIITNIPIDKIEMLSVALGVTVAYLMGWEETSPAGGMTGEADAQRARIEKAIAMLSAENKEQLLQYAEFLAQQEAKKGGQ